MGYIIELEYYLRGSVVWRAPVGPKKKPLKDKVFFSNFDKFAFRFTREYILT